jgi:hypothetical protein
MLAPPFQYSYLYLMPDAVIEQALRDAQNILWRNLPPTQSQSDEAVVRALRDIVRSARVKSVLERGSDTALVFVLRATNKVLADESETPREIIARVVIVDAERSRRLVRHRAMYVVEKRGGVWPEASDRLDRKRSGTPVHSLVLRP